MTQNATSKEDKESPKKTNDKQEKILTKLKSVCKKCTKASMMVYFRNIKRLYRLIEDGPIPLTGDWLGKKVLMEKYKKLPLNIRRHLSVSAVKACQMYKRNVDKWTVEMYKDSSKYEQDRNLNKRTDKERKEWPTKGYAAVKKAAKMMWDRVKVLLSKEDEPNLKTLYKYQMFIVLKLFSQIPFRNTFASFHINKSKEGNYIEKPKKGNFKFIVNEHKTVKKLGPKTVDLSRANTMALRKFLKYRDKVDIEHDYLLSTKNGLKMTKAALGKAIHRTTKELLGKSFGSRLIRILAATDSKKEIDKVNELANKMLHTAKQTKQYTREKD